MEKNVKSAQNGTHKVTASKPVKAKANAAQGLRDLFVAELKDIYWAEQALTKALPNMLKNSSSAELIKALDEHLGLTQQHITKLGQVFNTIGEKLVAKKCQAMEGLINEAEEIMESTEVGVVRDAGIISAAQKIEHYKIATYGTLSSFAKTLGEDKAASLLAETLIEEKEADEKLSKIAESVINIQAAEEEN